MLKKVLKKMSKRELEVKILTNIAELKELSQKVDSYRETVEKWQARAEALSKQCADLGTVMKRYITDKKTKPGRRVRPAKIVRSVGLQITTLADQRQKQKTVATSSYSNVAVKKTVIDIVDLSEED